MTPFEFAISASAALLAVTFVLAVTELLRVAGRLARAAELRNEITNDQQAWARAAAEEHRELQRAAIEHHRAGSPGATPIKTPPRPTLVRDARANPVEELVADERRIQALRNLLRDGGFMNAEAERNARLEVEAYDQRKGSA